MTIMKATGVFEERGDTDWFRMKLVAGQTYQIRGPNNGQLNVLLPSGEVMTVPIPYSNYAHFVAPVSGDYFLSVTSFGSTDPYQLTVEDVPDPNPAAITTPHSLAVGGTVTVDNNNNSVSIEDDWFAIDVVAGQSYLLSTDAITGRVYVVDGAGEVIAIEGYLGQGGDQVHFTATETGRLYAGAQHFGGTTYTLSLEAIADDHGEIPASAGNLTIGVVADGVWESKGDEDAYAVTLTAGSSYSFAVAVQDDITKQGFIRILDQSGAEVWNSQTQLQPPSTIFSAAADGVYYVVAGSGLSGFDSIDGWDYTITSAVVANELTDNVLTTGTLAVGGDAAGSWEGPGDADWFAIDLVAGQSYLFTMDAGASFNATVYVYGPQGEEEATSFGSQIHYTAEVTGTYYVSAMIGQQPGAYTLSAEAVEDDYADNISTTGQAVNGVISGVFEVGNDVDWFAVELVAGRTYSLQGPSAVYDAQGNPLTQTNIQDASFTAAATGTYYLAASGGIGDYEYAIVQINDDYLESAATTGVLRQDLLGTANPDTLVGTGAYELFMGLGGDDLFIAGTGYDRFEGGGGIDTLSYAASTVAMEVNLLAARSMIAGQFDDSIVGVENVTGSAFGDIITGNGLANKLNGLGGADQLNGSGGDDVLDGGAGTDQMNGGTGNDFFYVDAGDAIVEATGGGTDRVFTTVSYALTAGAEVETMSTTLHTGTTAINLNGNEFANAITGNDGVNFLDGKGGADTLIGRLGNDFYYVDNAGDRVIETAGQGNDRVFASASYTLFAGADVEVLSTVLDAGTAAINLTGNELANTLYGNDGVNILNGAAGADTMAGRLGDDFYYVDNAADRAVEAAGQGNDRVFASASYALAAGTSVETLSTTLNTGTAAINLGGNEIANTVYGNDGANTLDGKAGADLLVGRLGDDFYYVDNAGDRVIEVAGEGNDRVFASANFALNAGAAVETLSTVSNAGTAAINLTGNELANTLYGNAGANVLDGKGGADVLVGFAGGDSFAFTTALGAGNVDRIVDFSNADDTIQLDDAVFAGIGALGALDPNAFVTGTAAQDAGDRIVYNQATGQLFFDADGSGVGAAVLFATVQGAPVLTASDFLVI